jgi:hypothetical protein
VVRRRRAEGGGWRVEGGGWRVEGGGWREEGGGRREEEGNPGKKKSVLVGRLLSDEDFLTIIYKTVNSGTS